MLDQNKADAEDGWLTAPQFLEAHHKKSHNVSHEISVHLFRDHLNNGKGALRTRWV